MPGSGGRIRTATLSISSNDADESPYTFAISGRVPEITSPGDLSIELITFGETGDERRSSLKLTWDKGTLQRADDLESWQDVPEAVSPYMIEPEASRVFFRIRGTSPLLP